MSEFTGNNQYSGLTVEERFWQKVNVLDENECWEWKASTHHQWGYGNFVSDKKCIAAHRFSWILINGEIPEGMFICHHCDNPSCVNPKHLFLGTPLDNVRDKVKKGRDADVSGESNGRSILDKSDVLEIRKLYKQGGWSHRTLGEKYKVHRSTIKAIIDKRNWGHI